jgi:hypothetical protein
LLACYCGSLGRGEGSLICTVCKSEVHFKILVEIAEQELILKHEKYVHIGGAAYRTPTVYTIANEKNLPYIVEMARHTVLILSM